MSNDIDMPCYQFAIPADKDSGEGIKIGGRLFRVVIDDKLPVDAWGYFCPPKNLPPGKWELRFVPDDWKIAEYGPVK